MFRRERDLLQLHGKGDGKACGESDEDRVGTGEGRRI